MEKQLFSQAEPYEAASFLIDDVEGVITDKVLVYNRDKITSG